MNGWLTGIENIKIGRKYIKGLKEHSFEVIVCGIKLKSYNESTVE